MGCLAPQFLHHNSGPQGFEHSHSPVDRGCHDSVVALVFSLGLCEDLGMLGSRTVGRRVNSKAFWNTVLLTFFARRLLLDIGRSCSAFNVRMCPSVEKTMFESDPASGLSSSNRRYRYLSVSDSTKLSIRSSSRVAMTSAIVANPQGTLAL
jgi:hypothetical protein